MLFNFRKQESEELKKKKIDVVTLEKSIQTSKRALQNAKKDIGNITVGDVENKLKKGQISQECATQTINAIECLQMLIHNYPEMIKMFETSKSKLLKEIKNLQGAV